MFKFIFSKIFLVNLLIALLFATIVVWGIFKFIDSYTHHGESISVPSLEGLTIEEVKSILEEKELRYSILDSIYIPDAEEGVVLDQNPNINDLVKKNRTIYITVTKTVPPKIAMPSVAGEMSLRLAVAKLESYGLKVDVKYTPSECVNCVLMQEINGKEIQPKTPINKGSIITITVGIGESNERALAPYLLNLNQKEAKRKLIESSLNLGLSHFENCNCETAKDSLNARVYKQNPIRSQNIAVKMGSEVDIYLTCDTNVIDFNPPVIDTTVLDSAIKVN